MSEYRIKTIAIIINMIVIKLIESSPLASSHPAAIIRLSTTTCNHLTEDRHLPHENDCTKYYRCVYGKKVLKECPQKMLFNQFIGNCDLYYNVDCHLEVPQKDAEDNETLELLVKEMIVSNNILSASTTITSDRTTNGEIHGKFVYVPHEEDLSAYYKYEMGEKFLLRCEEGMIFDFDLEICAHF